jgi:hypothetical protein
LNKSYHRRLRPTSAYTTGGTIQALEEYQKESTNPEFYKKQSYVSVAPVAEAPLAAFDESREIHSPTKSFIIKKKFFAFKIEPRIEARCLNKGHVMEYITKEKWEERYPNVKNDNICSICMEYIFFDKKFKYNTEPSFLFEDKIPGKEKRNNDTRYCVQEM